MAPKAKAKAVAAAPLALPADDAYMVNFSKALDAVRDHRLFKGCTDLDALPAGAGGVGAAYDPAESQQELSGRSKAREYHCFLAGSLKILFTGD